MRLLVLDHEFLIILMIDDQFLVRHAANGCLDNSAGLLGL